MPHTTTGEAEQSLRDIERVRRRAGILEGYERGAPQLILWGIIWAVGYGLSAVSPKQAGVVWLALWAVGLIGGARLARCTGKPLLQQGSWRSSAATLTVFAFIFATYIVMSPREEAQFGAFPPLVVALVYVLRGIWNGTRWVVIGVLLGALTVIGYSLIHDHFLAWIAVVGSMTLIGTGLWLRR